MKPISIRAIRHDEHRYETAGDWYDAPDGTLAIRVSDLGDPRFTTLLAIHELVEALLCRFRGIPVEAVDAWDQAYADGEPGDDPRAPYHREHRFAELVERLLAHELGVDWAEYEAAGERLWDPPPGGGGKTRQ